MHIYDKDFVQGPLPMTKQEIRAISIAKLQLEEDSVLIDVGAGTGTIGIEAARYIPKGKVYAIEKEEKGLETIVQNLQKFSLQNYVCIHGRAPEDIPKISYDRMFIGGSTGSMREIIDHFLEYGTEKAILVVNIIALESLQSLQVALKERGFTNPEVVQVQVSRGKKVGTYTMMYGENPIYIVKVEKGERIS